MFYSLFMYSMEQIHGIGVREHFIASTEDPEYVTKVADSQKMELRAEMSENPDFIGNVDEYIPCPIEAALLFPWKMEVEREIEEYSFLEPMPYDEELKVAFEASFREMVRECSPRELLCPDMLTWRSYLTTTKIYHKGKRLTNSVARSECPGLEFPERFRFYRMPVQSSVDKTRDAVGGDIPTMNAIKGLDYLGKQLFKHWPHDLMCAQDLDREIKKFWRRNRVLADDSVPHFVMTDIKKCGLTFPHWILHSMADVLSQEYPNVEYFRYLKGFSNAMYFDEKDRYVGSPRQGYFLGMANRYASAALACLFHMWKQDFEDGIFFNDDQVITVVDHNRVKEWWDFLAKAGIWVNLKKSFYTPSSAPAMVMCERYFNYGHSLVDRRLFNLTRLPVNAASILDIAPAFNELRDQIDAELDPLYWRDYEKIKPVAYHLLAVIREIICYDEILKEIPFDLGGLSDQTYMTPDFCLSVEAVSYLKAMASRPKSPFVEKFRGYLSSLPITYGPYDKDLVGLDLEREDIEYAFELAKRDAKKRKYRSWTKSCWTHVMSRSKITAEEATAYMRKYFCHPIDEWVEVEELPTPDLDPENGFRRWQIIAGETNLPPELCQNPKAWALHPNYAIDPELFGLAMERISQYTENGCEMLYRFIDQEGAFPIYKDCGMPKHGDPTQWGIWISWCGLSTITKSPINTVEDIEHIFLGILEEEFLREIERHFQATGCGPFEKSRPGLLGKPSEDEEDTGLLEEAYGSFISKVVSSMEAATVERILTDSVESAGSFRDLIRDFIGGEANNLFSLPVEEDEESYDDDYHPWESSSGETSEAKEQSDSETTYSSIGEESEYSGSDDSSESDLSDIDEIEENPFDPDTEYDKWVEFETRDAGLRKDRWVQRRKKRSIHRHRGDYGNREGEAPESYDSGAPVSDEES